ncbi:aminotransferase class I/II-fold pyridoxal phosphate-dependent enzyme [Shimia ponticola]|uniref:aminotransferase class I/II-fold pyridoxal phosphate-dependent enzyme n=1 Tax=Shimia ponticola TaxID=2582893 RepID=UPI0011BFE24C|nr:pyridoxal phosphate-dependent aminotransferase [Shimia ponticola]
MKVKIHTLFEYLLETTGSEPEAFVGFSLSQPPKLGDFLGDLDPDLSLDWNGQSFRGLPALRDNVLAVSGLSDACAPDDVLITAGAAEANYLAFQQLVAPGDRVVTETPGWPQIDVLGRAMGAEMVHVRRREDDGWAFPMQAFADAVTPDTRLIFLTNPNNPTGRLLTDAELRQVVDIARAADAWLVVDEVYAGLEWAGPRPPSIAGMYDKGITTGSVSKALGLQGLRTGWLICRDPEMVMDAVILRENGSEIMNIMGEVIAEIALRPERYAAALDAARAEAQKTLTMLDMFIAGQERLSWVRPEAGLIGLARVEGEDGETLARNLLTDPYRTFLLPGSAYNEPAHIRVGVGGGAQANLDVGLIRLAEYLGQ